MSRLSKPFAVSFLALVVTTVGCCDKFKQQLSAMELQYNDLQVANQELKRSLATSQTATTDLRTSLADSQTKLAAAQSEVDRLRRVGPGPGPGPKPGPGGEEIKFTLAADILFSPGKGTLSTAGTAKLRSIAGTIKQDYPGATVRVCGYTDSDPIRRTKNLWQDNLDLSANRAMAVTRELQKLGISAENVETVAMGATNFVAPNTTAAGKAKNRRVEILVVRK